MPAETARTYEPLLIDLAAVAALISVSTKTVRRMIALGELPGVRRIGRRVLVSRAELQAWVERGCPRVGPRLRR
jgi:excisionase family DNA binding protein